MGTMADMELKHFYFPDETSPTDRVHFNHLTRDESICHHGMTTWDLATLLLHVESQNSINFAAEAAKLDNQMLPSRKQHKDVADGFHSIRNSFARLNLKETSSTSAG